MGIKIEVPYETLDNIVLVGLKAQLKSCKFVLNQSSHPGDIKDYTELVNAIEVVIKYYGG
jgi:hypothetical protein